MSSTFDADAFATLVRTRRSIRSFRPDPIPAEVLERVLADATWAPSGSNAQPYVLCIASGEKRDRISAAYCALFDASLPVQRRERFAKVRAFVTRRGLRDGDYDTTRPYPPEMQQRRRATGFGLYAALGIDRKDRARRDAQMRRNFEFFGAPTAIFVFVHAGMYEWAIEDAGMLLQTLMLSAHANGLGTCAQGALTTWASPVRAEFDVPADYKLLVGCAIGYADDDPVNTFNPGRLPLTVLA